MFFAGVDIGSRATKVVIMNENRVLSHGISLTGLDSIKSAYMALDEALERASLRREDLSDLVSTGYGRIRFPLASKNVSDLASHAKGVTWHFPERITVLDIGGQDIKAIQCDAQGKLLNFIMNDKCAGGTGRFLEVMADLLGLPIDEIGELSLGATQKVLFTSVCVLFVKSQAMTLYRQGVPKSDILAGVFDSAAVQCANLLAKAGGGTKVVMTGGVARNRGVVNKIEEKTGAKIVVPEHPQLIGALGAAVFARKRFLAGKDRGAGPTLRRFHGENDPATTL